MIPKPLQALVLAPLVFAHLAPSFFLWVLVLALAGVGLWWLRMVLALLFRD